jgi:hypothetical protein
MDRLDNLRVVATDDPRTELLLEKFDFPAVVRIGISDYPDGLKPAICRTLASKRIGGSSSSLIVFDTSLSTEQQIIDLATELTPGTLYTLDGTVSLSLIQRLLDINRPIGVYLWIGDPTLIPEIVRAIQSSGLITVAGLRYLIDRLTTYRFDVAIPDSRLIDGRLVPVSDGPTITHTDQAARFIGLDRLISKRLWILSEQQLGNNMATDRQEV